MAERFAEMCWDEEQEEDSVNHEEHNTDSNKEYQAFSLV